MNTSKHHGEAFALALAAILCAFTPGLAAQSGDNPQQHDQQPAQSKIFEGKIQKLPSGQYALVTGQSAEGKLSGHFLDDQTNAKKYEGKQVKVTGSFDTGTNTIHVTNIQAP